MNRTQSGANRWVPCPGSLLMEDRFPRSPKHPSAIEGDTLHWACEKVLWSWRTSNLSNGITLRGLLGASCPKTGLVITEDMVADGQVYIDAVWAAGHRNPDLIEPEETVSLVAMIPGIRDGRIDARVNSPDFSELDVFDLKYGHKPVSPFQNWQLLCYGLGSIRRLTQTIRLHIVQPRDHIAASPVKTWTLSRLELLDYARWIVQAASLDSLKAGTHCYKCRAAGSCDTLAAAGLYAGMEEAGEPVEVEIDERRIAFELELCKRAKSMLEARQDGLEGLANARILEGKVIPGYQRKSTMGNRKFVNEAHARAMAQLLGINIEEPQKLCSPKQAEVRGMPEAWVAANVVRRPGAPKLVQVDAAKAREVFRT